MTAPRVAPAAIRVVAFGAGTVAVEFNGFRLVNPVNGSHGHWAPRAARARAHRAMAIALRFPLAAAGIVGGRDGGRALAVPAVRVEMCRRGPRGLDDDNLAAAFKHIRDGIADELGIDDRDPRVAWLYSQARATYGVVVRVRAMVFAHSIQKRRTTPTSRHTTGAGPDGPVNGANFLV